MMELQFAGYTQPAFKKTTIAGPLLEDSSNGVKDAEVARIDLMRISDITYIGAKEGWLYHM